MQMQNKGAFLGSPQGRTIWEVQGNLDGLLPLNLKARSGDLAVAEVARVWAASGLNKGQLLCLLCAGEQATEPPAAA